MKKIIYFLILISFLAIGALIHHVFTFTYITAKFKHLRPIHGNLNVYYKGIVIGKAKELKHSDNYNHTLMRIILFPKNLHLPSNTTISLKMEKRNNKTKDFLELEYPKNPSSTLLSNNSTIEGYATVDTETYLANQNPNEIEEIKEDLAQSAKNLNYALSSLGQIFETLDEILRENQKNIYQTTKNVENVTLKINRGIKQQNIENSLSNVENITQGTSQTIVEFNQTIPNLNNTLKELEQTTCNLNKITCGIRKTLSKNLGGLRLFFGKTIE